MNADGSGQRNLTRSPANEGRFAWAPGRSKQGATMPGRVHRLIAVGIVAIAALGAPAGGAPAPAGGEERRASAGGRVTREMSPEAKSVIVFVSVGGKEYAATAGTRRPKADQRFRIGSVTKTFTATIVFQLMEEGKLRLNSTLEEHLPGVVPRGGRSRPAPARSPLGTRERHGLPRMAQGGGTVALDQSDQQLALCGLQAAGVPARQPGALFEHELPRARSRDRAGHGTLVQRLEERVLDPLGLSRTELPTTRRLSDLDDAGLARTFPGRRARSSRTRTTSLLLRPLGANSVRRLAWAMKEAKTCGVFGTGLGIFSMDLACGRSFGHLGGILDYLTLVTASAEGDRVAVSFRGPGFVPWLGRALLCAEPPCGGLPRTGRRISVHEQRRPGSQPAVRRERRRERAAVADAQCVDLRPRLVWTAGRSCFESLRDGDGEIYVVNADGAGSGG